MSNEHFGECRLVVDHLDDRRLFQSHDDAVRHGRDGRYAPRLPGKTPFAEKLTWPKNRNDGFLPLLRNDGELDLTLLHIKDGIRGLALRIDSLVLTVFSNTAAVADLGEKRFRVE